MNELKKVIGAMLKDKVTADDCRNALTQLDGMEQAVKDANKAIDVLKKQRESLVNEVTGLSGKIADAGANAAKIVAVAQADADNIIDKAGKEASKLLEDGRKEHGAIMSGIANAEATAKQADEKAAKSKAELAAIEKALDQARAKLRSVIGE